MHTLQGRITFQHVARHGSFAAATRAMPYGISEGAVRKQIRALEREMGVALFHRQPFKLTADGRYLYEHDRPHFEALSQGGLRLRQRAHPKLRAGITGSAAKRFLLPAVRTWVQDHGREAIATRSGQLQQLIPALQTGELDLLVTAQNGEAPQGLSCHLLATFALVLLAPMDSPLRSSDELWTQKPIREPLIAPGPEDPVTQIFERGLGRGGLTWRARLTHDSPAEVVRLVAAGLGLGLALAAEPIKTSVPEPERRGRRRPPLPSAAPLLDPGIRVLPLAGFDPVPVVALWHPAETHRLREPLALMGYPGPRGTG